MSDYVDTSLKSLASKVGVPTPSTRVEQYKTGEWLWIGGLTSRDRDGTLRAYISRWGKSGFATEAEAQAEADAWLASEAERLS